jgi:4-hydroxybenzoate polyprenyltransferase
MNAKVFLTLGRVSNLPTVWTNCIAGAVLATAAAQTIKVSPLALVALLAAMTLAYIGGMFLNDAFDHRIDAIERPERPIPAGLVSPAQVYTWGFAMLAISVALVAWTALGNPHSGGWMAIVSAIALCGAIVLYNAWHKNNPLSPFVMGLCRMLVYTTAAYSVTANPAAVLFAAAVALLCYLIGLTYVAKQENIGNVKNLWPLLFLAAPLIYGAIINGGQTLGWIALAALALWLLVAINFVRRRNPGDIPRAVISMIAGISLVDAIFIAAMGASGLAILAWAGFATTLLLQKVVSGT